MTESDMSGGVHWVGTGEDVSMGEDRNLNKGRTTVINNTGNGTTNRKEEERVGWLGGEE